MLYIPLKYLDFKILPNGNIELKYLFLGKVYKEKSSAKAYLKDMRIRNYLVYACGEEVKEGRVYILLNSNGFPQLVTDRAERWVAIHNLLENYLVAPSGKCRAEDNIYEVEG